MSPSQIAMPLAMGAGGLAAGQWGAGAMGLALAGLAALVFYMWCVSKVPCVRNVNSLMFAGLAALVFRPCDFLRESPVRTDPLDRCGLGCFRLGVHRCPLALSKIFKTSDV